MALVYEEHFRATHTECDAWNRMTPGAVLRRVQEISTAHCEALGLGEEVYRRTHTAFLLSRLSLAVTRAPHLQQEIRLQTRAHGIKRAVFYRTTRLLDADGALLCEVDARWILADTQTRRILRRYPEEFGALCTDLPQPPEQPLRMPAPPERLYELEQAHATYTLCDRNRHINNARYADIVCDHLPLERLAEGLPSQMLLLYRAEIPLGSCFRLRGGPAEEGWYFVAEEENRRNFECFVTF